MDEANPRTAIGKRGLYSDGMNNNLNKVKRLLEDAVQAITVGHTFMDDKGMALLEALMEIGQAAVKVNETYNAYAREHGTGEMTLSGSRNKSGLVMGIMMLETQLKANREALEAILSKKAKQAKK